VGTGADDVSPPRWMQVAIPTMKAVGMGAAAGGNVLGPMLVSGGQFFQDFYQQKVDTAAMKKLLPMMTQTRSFPIAGTTPAVGLGNMEAAAATGDPTIGVGGQPPSSRSATVMTPAADLLKAISDSPDVPESVKLNMFQRALGLNMPRFAEMPPEIKQAETEATEERKRLGDVSALEAAGVSGARATAISRGYNVPEAPKTTYHAAGEKGFTEQPPTGPPVFHPSPEYAAARERELAQNQRRDQAIAQVRQFAADADAGRPHSNAEWEELARRYPDVADVQNVIKTLPKPKDVPERNLHWTFETDANGQRWRVGSDPVSGARKVREPAGVGKVPGAAGAGKTPQTIETSETSWQRVNLTDPTIRNDMNAQVQGAVMELGKNPQFSDPKRGTVEVPGIGTVPKTEVIRQYLLRQGVKATVRWDGSKFVVIEASRVQEKTRRRGPAPPPKAGGDDSGEDDE
jgi:hypothetical protein